MSSIPFDSATTPLSALTGTPGNRKLNEGVLQSAEEAVIRELDEPKIRVRPGMDGFTAETWESVLPDKDGVYEAMRDDDDDENNLSAYQARKANAVKRFVAIHPGQSALIAAAAGALAMIVLRSRLRKLTWRRSPTRRR